MTVYAAPTAMTETEAITTVLTYYREHPQRHIALMTLGEILTASGVTYTTPEQTMDDLLTAAHDRLTQLRQYRPSTSWLTADLWVSAVYWLDDEVAMVKHGARPR